MEFQIERSLHDPMDGNRHSCKMGTQQEIRPGNSRQVMIVNTRSVGWDSPVAGEENIVTAGEETLLVGKLRHVV